MERGRGGGPHWGPFRGGEEGGKDIRQPGPSKVTSAFMAEWLRRQTQVLVLSEGVGSNPTECNFFFFFFFFFFSQPHQRPQRPAPTTKRAKAPSQGSNHLPQLSHTCRHHNSAYSSVGRAGDCSCKTTDISRSLVRIRVGGFFFFYFPEATPLLSDLPWTSL